METSNIYLNNFYDPLKSFLINTQLHRIYVFLSKAFMWLSFRKCCPQAISSHRNIFVT